MFGRREDPRVYVHRVTIQNLRSFREVVVPLATPGANGGAAAEYPNVTLLVGDNGAGKTTVLRSIALAALGPIMVSGSGYVPFSLVRHVSGQRSAEAVVSAEVELHEQDGAVEGQFETAALRIRPTAGFVDRFVAMDTPAWSELMWADRSPAFFVVGYGASRAVDPHARSSESSRSKSRMLRYGRVAGLFEEGIVLLPLAAWLPELAARDPARFAEVVGLVNVLLEPHGELLDHLVEGEPMFRVGSSVLPFQALSDGYRGYIGWVGDLLYHLCMGAPAAMPLVQGRGVVLVDEVDLHLHPAWQRHVMPTLSRALPNLQFVFTSHSPLVVGSLYAVNVRVLDAMEVGSAVETVVSTSRAEVYGLSADQILTGGHFGLRTTRVESFDRKLQQVASKARSGDADAALH
jgi:hypothetical protein